MPYVVKEECIRCVYLDCVQVCPVDCFYIGANMVVIHPDECIDCGVCEPECPVNAIVSDTNPDAPQWLEHNRVFSEKWPNIVAPTEKKPPSDAEHYQQLTDKFRQFFDPSPGNID